MLLSSVLPALSLVTAACGRVIPRQTSSDMITQFLPIPAAAAGPQIPSSGYYVEDFGQGAYMVTDGSYQALFLVSTDGVIVVDNPPTIGANLLYAIGNVTHLPITHLVYSHSHADHIGGAILLLNDKLTIIAQTETAKLLKPVNDPNRPLPDITFKKHYILKVGNQTLDLSYQGPNHLDGNIFIYARRQRVLMLVDVIFPGWIPFANLGEVGNVPGFIEAHDQILEYDFEHFVGGHLARAGNRADVEIQREYIQDLYSHCAETIRITGTDDPVLGGARILGPVLERNPGNSWAAFQVYLEVTAGDCANKTSEKWVNRLAGSDVFQFSNAAMMVESLRIDFGVLGAFANR